MCTCMVEIFTFEINLETADMLDFAIKRRFTSTVRVGLIPLDGSTDFHGITLPNTAVVMFLGQKRPPNFP